MFQKELENVRQLCSDHSKKVIIENHNKTHIFDNQKEIKIDEIYVDVWLLDKPPSNLYVSPEKLLEKFDLLNDRIGLENRIKRMEGVKFAKENDKILILGKPGSGKTTFLKHLAIEWSRKRFKFDLIAVFIKLGNINTKDWDLIAVIQKELEIDKEWCEVLLEEGKLLLMMDGFDEIPTEMLRHEIQEKIVYFSNQYFKNHFIITCRTQIISSLPVGFVHVEVADFNVKQVENFVKNWFVSTGDSREKADDRWEEMNLVIECSSDIKELTVTPVLLSLMCLVFEHQGEMPTSKKWLYKRGIELLLSKWNDSKWISNKNYKKWEIGTEAYRCLSVKDKKRLLAEIASRKFDNPHNFLLFEQEEMANQIVDILNLPSQEEGVNVLEAIETQHGLLIERADELWSFSHLTFQEFFTQEWLAELAPEQILNKISSDQWQDVVKKILKTQQPSDKLIKLIKQSIDQSIADISQIQFLLEWLLYKSSSLNLHYTPAAIRLFYLGLTLEFNPRRNSNILAKLMPTLRSFDYRLFTYLNQIEEILVGKLEKERSVKDAMEFDFILFCAMDKNSGFELAHDFHFKGNALKMMLDLTSSNQLQHNKLQELVKTIPESGTWTSFFSWWQINGKDWIAKLQKLFVHEDIGCIWEFSDEEWKQISVYYEMNVFLAEILSIDGAVSDHVRHQCENSLVVPWTEIKKHQYLI